MIRLLVQNHLAVFDFRSLHMWLGSATRLSCVGHWIAVCGSDVSVFLA
jgi:hypothetical protein